MRLGALDVLSKGTDMEDIRGVLDRAFVRLSIRSETFPISDEDEESLNDQDILSLERVKRCLNSTKQLDVSPTIRFQC